MTLEKIKYNSLNSKQKENYNYHKVASALADYGYDSIELVWGNVELNKKGGKTLKGDWCIQYWSIQTNKNFEKRL